MAGLTRGYISSSRKAVGSCPPQLSDCIVLRAVYANEAVALIASLKTASQKTTRVQGKVSAYYGSPGQERGQTA